MGSRGLARRISRIPFVKTLTASTAAALLAGGAMAVGAIPSAGSGTIFACSSTKTGDLRIVDKNERCGTKETRLSWNKEGAKGDTGAAGAIGPAGARGPAGPLGPKGATGAVGPAGAKGDTGAAGTNGTKGDRGDAGTNGTNGVNGAKGEIGIAGINGV